MTHTNQFYVRYNKQMLKIQKIINYFITIIILTKNIKKLFLYLFISNMYIIELNYKSCNFKVYKGTYVRCSKHNIMCTKDCRLLIYL